MKLPDFQPQLGMSPDPQGAFVSPYHFGNEGEAAAHVGRAVSDFSFNLMEKRKEADDKDYAYSNVMKDARDIQDFTQTTRASLPADDHGNTDYKGYSDKVGQWMQDRFQQNQDNAPSETARLLYKQHAGNLFNEHYIDAKRTENTERAKNYVNNIVTDGDKAGIFLETNPDPGFARDQMSMLKERIRAGVGTIADESLAKKVSEHAFNGIATSLLDGLYSKGKGDSKNGHAFLQQGIDLLRGQIEPGAKLADGVTIDVDPIKSSLKPHQIESYLLKFQQAMKDNKQTSLTELNARFNDSIHQLMDGKPSQDTVIQDFGNAVAAGDIPKEVLPRKIDEYTTAKAVGDISKQMRDTSPSAWPDLLKKFEGNRNQILQGLKEMFPDVKALSESGFNKASKDGLTSDVVPGANQQFSSLGIRILSERNQDPVGTVEKQFQSIAALANQAGIDPDKTKAYIDAVVAKQRQWGIGEDGIRISSRQQSFTNAKYVSGNSPEQVANGMGVLEKKYGQYFSQAFSEMVADKTGVDPKLWAASYIKDPQARQLAVGAIINRDDGIDKAFKDRYTEKEARDLENRVKDKTGALFAGLSQTSDLGGSLQLAHAMQDLVQARAKSIMAQRAGKVDAGSAVDEAMGMISSAFGVAQAGNSIVTYPRDIADRPMDQKIIEAYMQAYSHKDALATKNLYIPPDYGGPGISEKERQDKYLSQIQDSGKWVPNAQNDGIYLTIPTAKGMQKVPDKNGEKVEIKYKDMLGNVKDPFVNQELNKGFLQKIFGH